MDYNDHQHIIQTLSKDLHDFKTLLDKEKFWNEEHNRINAIKDWNASIEQMQLKETQLALKITSKNNDLEKIKNNINNINYSINSLSSYENILKSWKDVLTKINNDKQIYAQNDSLSKQIDHLQKLLKSFDLQNDINDLQRFLQEQKIIIDTKYLIHQYK